MTYAPLHLRALPSLWYFESPVEGPVKGPVEVPVEGPIEGNSLEPKDHSLSTYKRGYDRASQKELVKQDMAKEKLVNSHDLLGPGQ
ncbi:hypothetical protein Tco_1322005 [Tanacetum coccineum]